MVGTIAEEPETDDGFVSLLLVEDNPGDADLACERLSSVADCEFRTEVVRTLRAAIEAVANRQVDVVVLDLNLPDSRGIETLRRLRMVRNDVAIVVLSGEQHEELRRLAIREGAQDFLEKNELAARVLVRSILYAVERHRVSQQQQQLHKLVTLNPDAVFVIDDKGCVRFVNRAATEMFGLEAGNFTEDRLGFTVAEGTVSEIAIVSGNRSARRVGEMYVVRCAWESDPAVFAFVRETTSHRKLEEQLRQAQKMEAVGRLAGGIAHDFNNLLTVILGHSDMLLGRLDEDDAIVPSIHEIHGAGNRAAELTKQLLAFSRKSLIKPVALDLNEVIDGVERMLRRLIGEDIELSVMRSPNIGKISADPTQIEQAILNLAVNSRDAMPTGGQLVIETNAVDVDEPFATEHAELEPGRFVVLSISDNGVGMSKETQERIFEPFFTTKKLGEGTGLGLATVYGIVKQTGGSIFVYSEVDHGTTFRIYFPTASVSKEPVEATRGTADILTGGETVLLVEDEKAIRHLIRIAFESYGYTILEAESGTAALKQTKSYDGMIDLVITDVVMPKMSGPETVEAIQRKYPDVKVLYMSGYTDDTVVRYGILESGTPFLQKPFSPTQIVRKAREVLDH